MALPKLDLPSYELELPLSKKKVKYRPFLVKEQRNLLMAVESGETNTIQQSVKDILYNCTLTEGVDIEKLPIVDVEYYFINLRARSVGEVVDARYRCNNEVDGKPCNNVMEEKINLLELKVQFPEEVSDEIKLNEHLFIKMKYPEFGIVKDSLNYDSVVDVTFNMIANSIEYIYDNIDETFYYAREAQPGEMLEFVESMNQEQFSRVEKFFNNMPQLKKTVDMICSKCGFHHTIEVEGLENFFG